MEIRNATANHADVLSATAFCMPPTDAAELEKTR